MSINYFFIFKDFNVNIYYYYIFFTVFIVYNFEIALCNRISII